MIHRIGPPADGRRDRVRRHPGRGAGGDRHVYDNHVDQFLEQLGREPYPYPTIEIRKADSLFDYQYEDFKVVGYQHRPVIKTPVAV